MLAVKFNVMFDEISRLTEESQMKTIASQQRTNLASIVVVITMLTLSGGVLFSTSHKITQSIQKLHEGTLLISRGNLDRRVEIEGADEIAKLAEAFNAMAQHLDQDITERKLAEELLRKSEEKYRTLFEESFDGLFITSPGGKILDMNKKGVMMFGYDTKEEILSLDLEKDVYADPLDRKRILSMVNAQGTAEYEVVVKKKSGEKMMTHCSLTAVKDEKGMITTYRGIIRDITERKRAGRRCEGYSPRRSNH